MGQWFYAEGNRQQGPLTSEELISLFTSSRIGLDTLVWRDGLPAWQPLRSVADELGLATAAPATPAPPALPDTPDTLLEGGFHVDPPPAVPEPAAPRAPATFQIDTATRTPAPPPPRSQPQPGYAAVAAPPKKSGCGPVAIVLAVVGVVLLVIIAILAAIALPAYNDYVTRAKVAGAVANLSPLKSQVAEFVLDNHRCPVNGDDGFNAPEAYAFDGVAAVRIGRFAESGCGVEIELSAPGKRELDGKMIWFEYDLGVNEWTCSSSASERVLPPTCKQ